MYTRKIKVASFLALGLLLIVIVITLIQPVTFAQIGNQKITKKSILYQEAIQAAYAEKPFQPSDIVSNEAVMELMRLMLEKEAARLVGITVTSNDINDFSLYVDTTTKAPELLAQIKKIFEADQASYQTLYLAPKINIQKLHAFYSEHFPSGEKSFDDWFQEQAGGISIKISDQGLHESICRAYSQVWWLKETCTN